MAEGKNFGVGYKFTLPKPALRLKWTDSGLGLFTLGNGALNTPFGEGRLAVEERKIAYSSRDLRFFGRPSSNIVIMVQPLSFISYSIDKNEVKFARELSVTNKSIKPNRKYLSVFRVETSGDGYMCMFLALCVYLKKQVQEKNTLWSINNF